MWRVVVAVVSEVVGGAGSLTVIVDSNVKQLTWPFLSSLEREDSADGVGVCRLQSIVAFFVSLCFVYRLVGLVVKASASRAEDLGFKSRLRRDFSGSSHTSDLKIGTPVATLLGAWRYRVSTGTGRPGVSIL